MVGFVDAPQSCRCRNPLPKPAGLTNFFVERENIWMKLLEPHGTRDRSRRNPFAEAASKFALAPEDFLRVRSPAGPLVLG